jgi:hypothetical protein
MLICVDCIDVATTDAGRNGSNLPRRISFSIEKPALSSFCGQLVSGWRAEVLSTDVTNLECATYSGRTHLGRNRKPVKLLRCCGPQRASHLVLRAEVERSSADNASTRIHFGVSDRSRSRRLTCALRSLPPERASVGPRSGETSRSPRGRLTRMHDVTRILSAIEQATQRRGAVHAAGLRRTAVPTFFASAVHVVVSHKAFR